MSEDIPLNCGLCGRTHIPIWGEDEGELVSGFRPPEEIIVPYNCPINGNKGDAIFPYSPEIYHKKIIGWKVQ